MIQRLEPGSTAYNIVAFWRCPEHVDSDRFVGGVQRLVARHEILRATFRDDGSGVPAVHLRDDNPVLVRDLGPLPEEELRRVVREAGEAASRSPFDLANEPPVRFVVFRWGAGQAALLVTAHHIAVDAWSMSLLERELAAACVGELGPPPGVQYADYAAWQRGSEGSAEIAADVEWWRRTLAGAPPVSTFPADGARSPEARGALHGFEWSRELSEEVRALAQKHGATVYMALVAACAAVLHWQTGQDDVVLGSPMGDRDRPELETVVGPFVNLLALRLDLRDDPTFADLLVRAREAVLGAHEHRQAPFEKLVEVLKPVRSFEHAPLFQIAVVQHAAARPGDASAAIASGGAIFDLTWFVREIDGRLVGSLEYRADLYSKVTIERLARRLEAVLEAAVVDAGRRVSEVSLLTPDEERRILVDFNATARAVDATPFAGQLERQVKASPEACAVSFEGEALTYRELNRRANQLARLLRTQAIGPGVVVGLSVPRCPAMLISLLAIQKSGATYLPLDPDFPSDRLAFMLEDSGARALVTKGDVRIEVPETVARIDLDAAREAIAGEPGEDLADGPAPSDLAYILYTSGSTGRPKGVRVSHAALSNFLGAMREEPGIGPSDVLAAVTTLSFDIAGLELYLPLTVGARVELIAKATASDGPALAAALGERGATLLQATPSTWRLLVEAGWRPPSGFRALSGGEASAAVAGNMAVPLTTKAIVRKSASRPAMPSTMPRKKV